MGHCRCYSHTSYSHLLAYSLAYSLIFYLYTYYYYFIYSLASCFFLQAGRGWHPINVWCDECDFAGTSFISKIILPLTTERGVKVFAASSANKNSGELTELIECKWPDGTTIMNYVILGEPCDACKLTDRPYECTHNLHETAEWKDPILIKKALAIYKAMGREDDANAEMFSIKASGGEFRFNEQHYGRLFSPESRKFFDPLSKIDVVVIGVDPAWGGMCEFAISAVGISFNNNFKYQVSSKNQYLYYLLLLLFASFWAWAWARCAG